MTVLAHWTVTDPDGRRLVHVVTDKVKNRMMISVDGKPVVTLTPVQARALGMALAEATYVGLEPDGPWLTLNRRPLD